MDRNDQTSGLNETTMVGLAERISFL